MKTNDKKTNGLRGYIIYGMPRQKQIDFIKRRDSSFIGTSFAGLSDKQVIEMALSVDRKVQADRQKKKHPLRTGKSIDNEG